MSRRWALWFDETRGLQGFGVGGGVRVAYQPTQDFGLAVLAAGGVLNSVPVVAHGMIEARWRVAGQHCP